MCTATLLLTGVPDFVTLLELDLKLGTDLIGTFKTRDLTTTAERLIALDFRSGYDAIAAQDRLHGYRYALPNGKEYTLCAKITRRPEFTIDGSPSRGIREHLSSPVADNCKPVDVVPAVTDGDIVRAHAKLHAQLVLLEKQKLILQAEMEVLRQRKKLKREYSKALDSEEEPAASRRRSLSPNMSRFPDITSRKLQLLRNPKTSSGSPPKAKLMELKSRSRSKEKSTPIFQKQSEDTRNLKEPFTSKESRTPNKAKKSSKHRSRSRNRRSRSKNRLKQSTSRSKCRSRSREVRRECQRSRERSWFRRCCLRLPNRDFGTRTAGTLRSPERWRWSRSVQRLCRLQPARDLEFGRSRPLARSPSLEPCSRQLAIMDDCYRSLEEETIILERNFAMDPVIDNFKDVIFDNNIEQQYSLKGVINNFDDDICKNTDIDEKVTNIAGAKLNESNSILSDVINLVEEFDTADALDGTRDGTKDEKHKYQNNVKQMELVIDDEETFCTRELQKNITAKDKTNLPIHKLSTVVYDRVESLVVDKNVSNVEQDSLLVEKKIDKMTMKTHNILFCSDAVGSNIGKDDSTALVMDRKKSTFTVKINEAPENTVTEVIEIIDNPAPPPARPKFVIIIKKLMKEMKSSIRKVFTIFPPHVKIYFQCKLRVLLREIVAGKDRMHKTQIMKSFREKYPKEQDDEFVEKIVRDMHAEKYGDLGWRDDVESTECRGGDDVVLIEKKYDTITILDSDDEPEPIKKYTKVLEHVNAGTNCAVTTTIQNITVDLERQRRRREWEAWFLARGLTPTSSVRDPRILTPSVTPRPVAIPPKKANSSHLGKLKAVNVVDINDQPTDEAHTLLNSSVAKLDDKEISGPSKVSAIKNTTVIKSETTPHAELQNNNSDGKTNSTKRIKSASTADEVRIKGEIESNDIVPEFTDVELESMLSNIENVDGSSADRIKEKEAPKVTAITIMTTYSELCSLKYGGNVTRKENQIKHERGESVEEYKEKRTLNTANVATINFPMKQEDTVEESVESISKYVESLCMCHQSGTFIHL